MKYNKPTSMIKIMTKTCDVECDGFEAAHHTIGTFDNTIHGVGHCESVRPIVVGNVSVVLLDRQHETRQHIHVET